MLHRLTYCSQSEIAGPSERTEAEIDALLSSSRKNNGKLSITGALLFSGRDFAQVLEGPRAAIERTYAKIRGDRRHSNLFLLDSCSIVDRDFGNWTMAYVGREGLSPQYKSLTFENVIADPRGAAKDVLELLTAIF